MRTLRACKSKRKSRCSGPVHAHAHSLSRQSCDRNPVLAGCGLLCGQAPAAAFYVKMRLKETLMHIYFIPSFFRANEKIFFTSSPRSFTEIAADAGPGFRGQLETGWCLLVSAPIVGLSLTCWVYSWIYDSSPGVYPRRRFRPLWWETNE